MSNCPKLWCGSSSGVKQNLWPCFPRTAAPVGPFFDDAIDRFKGMTPVSTGAMWLCREPSTVICLLTSTLRLTLLPKVQQPQLEITLDTVALLKEEMVRLRRHSRLGVNVDHDASFNSRIHTQSAECIYSFMKYFRDEQNIDPAWCKKKISPCIWCFMAENLKLIIIRVSK